MQLHVLEKAPGIQADEGRQSGAASTDVFIHRPREAPLRVDCLSRRDALEGLAEAWNRLAAEVPFRRWEWLDAWWRHMASGDDELFVLAVYDEGPRLAGLAPLYRSKSRLLGKTLRWLGSGLACSDYLSVLAADGKQSEVVAAMADWLTDEARGEWDALELEAVERDDPATRELVSQFTRRGFHVHERPALNCWRLPLKPDWEDYLHTLGSTRRNLVRKLTRRTFDSGRAVLRWVDGEDEFEHGWRILVDLHQRRRRSLGQRGCFSCPNFAAFLKLAARRFLRLGRLRLQWVELDGRPVVCELDFAGDQIVYLYQSGMDPDLTSERPGWLGTIAALRRAAADGFAAFDFLRGDEPYKAHWRAVPRPLVDYRIVATTARSRAHHMLWRAREEAKKQVKFLLRFYQGRRERRYGAATKDHRERQSPELPSPRES